MTTKPPRAGRRVVSVRDLVALAGAGRSVTWTQRIKVCGAWVDDHRVTSGVWAMMWQAWRLQSCIDSGLWTYRTRTP